MRTKKQTEYYYLRHGEIVRDGDEVETSNSWGDPPLWEPATTGVDVGTSAPDPHLPAHRRYRRTWELQAEYLAEQLAACAAGPWHDASEEPAKEGRYLARVRYRDHPPHVIVAPYNSVNSSDAPHWWLNCEQVLVEWAEIRESEEKSDGQ